MSKLLLFCGYFLYQLCFGTAKNSSISNRCSTDHFRYGQWIDGSRNCGLLDEYRPTLERLGQPRVHSYRDPEGKIVPPFKWSQYCWKPLNCNAKPFDRGKFCSSMKGKRIMFVGDSILYEMYAALFYQTLSDRNKIDTIVSQWDLNHINSRQLKWTICNGTVGSIFIRNDHVAVDDEDAEIREKSRNVNVMWRHLVPDHDVIILNKGHHVVKKEVVTEEMFHKASIKTVEYLKKRAREKTVVFVTTSPAHPHCRKTSSAVTTPLVTEPEYIKKELIPGYARDYGWENYHKHDLFLIDLFRKIDAIIVDIAPMSYLRPDGHAFSEGDSYDGDCLHYRLPATPDSWVYVMYNLLFNA